MSRQTPHARAWEASTSSAVGATPTVWSSGVLTVGVLPAGSPGWTAMDAPAATAYDATALADAARPVAPVDRPKAARTARAQLARAAVQTPTNTCRARLPGQPASAPGSQAPVAQVQARQWSAVGLPPETAHALLKAVKAASWMLDTHATAGLIGIPVALEIAAVAAVWQTALAGMVATVAP
eukprot:scaffold5330_cov125-Isochrysis_galbana.AAC.5